MSLFGHGCPYRDMLIRVKRHINLRMSVKRHVNFRMSVKRHVNLRLYANWHVSVRTSMSVKRHCKSHGTWISLYYTLKNCIQTRIVKSNRLQHSCHSDWNSLHVVYMWVCHSTRCKNIEFASWRVQYTFLFRLEANSMQNNVTLVKPHTKEKLFKKYHDFNVLTKSNWAVPPRENQKGSAFPLQVETCNNCVMLCRVAPCCSALPFLVAVHYNPSCCSSCCAPHLLQRADFRPPPARLLLRSTN